MKLIPLVKTTEKGKENRLKVLIWERKVVTIALIEFQMITKYYEEINDHKYHNRLIASKRKL